VDSFRLWRRGPVPPVGLLFRESGDCDDWVRPQATGDGPLADSPEFANVYAEMRLTAAGPALVFQPPPRSHLSTRGASTRSVQRQSLKKR